MEMSAFEPQSFGGGATHGSSSLINQFRPCEAATLRDTVLYYSYLCHGRTNFTFLESSLDDNLSSSVLKLIIIG